MKNIFPNKTSRESPPLPFFSVIIPVYNRTSELARAINSVLNQTKKNFEIIVVDDGSDVDIKSVCDSFSDTRIRFFRYSEHKNANVARNKGLREARGEYIAMLDSDDEFLPHHLEQRIRKIKEWDCDGIFGSCYFVVGERRFLRLSRPRNDNESMINYLLSDGFAQTSSLFFKRDAAIDIMWDESMTRHQDFDFSVRFADKYSYLSDYEPTVLMHWLLSDRKDINLDSCITFIEKNEQKIGKKIYNDYHRRLYANFHDHKNSNYAKHYARNSYRYIRFVSYADFMFVHNNQKIFDILLFTKFILLQVIAFMKTHLK